MDNYNITDNMFYDNPHKFKNQLINKYFIEEKASIVEVENGLILPPKQVKSVGWNCEAAGGCIDSFGNFIAGHYTHFDDNKFYSWRCCNQSYVPEKPVTKRNETVIFGGFLHYVFGHFITESISRLWYVLENHATEHKIIFLNFDERSDIPFENILYEMGISLEQCEMITQPTKFDKVIVPEQSLYIGNGFRIECRYIYDKIIANTQPSSFKKIYLSKTKYRKNSGIGEIYFEKFYKKRGYEIIYPEEHTFLEQVAILNGADEVVCTMGTIQHLTFFCKNNAKVTIFNRSYDVPINNLGMFSLQMRNLESYFVDITFNFLPAGHVGGTYLWGPTKHWINYLDSQDIHYEPEEVDLDIHIKPYLYDYLMDWVKRHKTPNNSNNIKNTTLPDIINLIHRTFLDETIDTKKFPERDDVVKMQNQIKELTATIEKQKLQLEEQKQSADLKENITQVVTQMGLPEAHQKLARQTEDKFNIVRNIVTKMEDNLKISDKALEEKCEILKDQVKKQNEKIKLLEERFIELEENSKSKGLFGKK